MIKNKEFKGYSDLSLDQAIENARDKAEKQESLKIIEAQSSLFSDEICHYQVTLALNSKD